MIIGCFATAAGLLIGRHYGNSLAKVEIPDVSIGSTVAAAGAPATTTALPSGEPASTGVAPTAAPAETFPPADPEAQNFLITGADNNSCIDPDSPYAKAFGDRSTMGERSDTVMVMRVDPSTKRAAVLSFPRDLWVTIAGRNNKNRINDAYVRNDPTRLIETIALNFGVPIDHFIQIDFCAFKTIVDSVDGGRRRAVHLPGARHPHRPVRPHPRLLLLRRRQRARVRPVPLLPVLQREHREVGQRSRAATSAGSPASRTSSGGCSTRRSTRASSTRASSVA